MINSLNHYTISAINIKENITFYAEVLGLEHGQHLTGAESGAYFYLPGNPIPVVHIVDQSQHKVSKGIDFTLDAHAVAETPKKLITGALDHIAFSVSIDSFDVFESRLKTHKLNYKVGQDLMPKMKQIWVLDPNGIKIELNFS